MLLRTAFFLILISSTFVRADFELPKEASNKTFKFEFPSVNKKPSGSTANIKFEERKKSVKIEFDGSGLKKGKYRIIKVQDCEVLKKSLIKRSVASEQEIFAFETEYGEISDEKNVDATSLNDLGLDGMFLALLKVEKKKDVFIACSTI